LQPEPRHPVERASDVVGILQLAALSLQALEELEGLLELTLVAECQATKEDRIHRRVELSGVPARRLGFAEQWDRGCVAVHVSLDRAQVAEGDAGGGEVVRLPAQLHRPGGLAFGFRQPAEGMVDTSCQRKRARRPCNCERLGRIASGTRKVAGEMCVPAELLEGAELKDRKSTRLNSSH